MVNQNQLLPISGTVMVSTRETLARLMQVQKVNSAACPLLGTITPSNLHRRSTKTCLDVYLGIRLEYQRLLINHKWLFCNIKD